MNNMSPDESWSMAQHMRMCQMTKWRLVSDTSSHSSDNYDSARPRSVLNVSVAILNSSRRQAGSQHISVRMGANLSALSNRLLHPLLSTVTDTSCL